MRLVAEGIKDLFSSLYKEAEDALLLFLEEVNKPQVIAKAKADGVFYDIHDVLIWLFDYSKYGRVPIWFDSSRSKWADFHFKVSELPSTLRSREIDGEVWVEAAVELYDLLEIMRTYI